MEDDERNDARMVKTGVYHRRMKGLLAQVNTSVSTHGLLVDGDRIVVAVSGGVDSVVLLRLLHDMARGHRWKLTIAHLNHGLRGRSSDGDERFVRNLAKRYRLK